MSRKIKVNGQLVEFETLRSLKSDDDYKDKKWRYTKTGDVEEVTDETEADDDIVFSGNKSSLRRIADLERNISVLATKVLTVSSALADIDDDDFSQIFDEDTRVKGDIFRVSSDLFYIDSDVDVDFNGAKITQVGAPSALTDAATKGYVDTSISNLVNGADASFNTLKEIQDAMATDAELATAIGNLSIPSNTSDLSNDSGFITSTADITGNVTGTVSDISNHSINALSDVDTTTSAPTQGQAIVWDSVNSVWKPGNVATSNESSNSDIILDTFIGTGSTTSFTLTVEPSSAEDVIVTLDGLVQRPTTDYNVSGTSLTFQIAPYNGAVIASRFVIATTSGLGTTIGDLADVDTSTPPLNGQTLIWNSSTEAFEPGTIEGYSDSDVGTYLSANGYDTSSNIIASITDSAPGTLDTLNELSAALGNDANFATTVTNSLSGKADLTGANFTGGISIAGNVVPSANETYDLGTSSARWRDLYISGSTIDMAGATIKTDTSTGSIALIPKPTATTPNPTGVVFTGSGKIKPIATTAGSVSESDLSSASSATDSTTGPTLYSTSSNLPSSNNTTGDLAFVTDIRSLFVWDGTEWGSLYQGVDLSLFNNLLTDSMPHSGSNVTEAGIRGGTSNFNASTQNGISNTNSGFGWHDGHDGSPADWPAYSAVYIGSAPKAVNQIQFSVHGNSFGNFELQGSNNAGVSGSFYNSGNWTSLTFNSSGSSFSTQNAGGASSGMSDGTVITFNYINNTGYTHYRVVIKDNNKPNEGAGTRFTGWACYGWRMNRV